MAAVQDSRSKDPAANRAGRGVGGGGEPRQKRARSSVGVDAGGGGGSSAPATAPAPASESRVHPESAAASLEDVTVEDADALDCVVCFLPLKAPIFQCDVGHMVCSLCRHKLQTTDKCHLCGVVTSSYRRCHGMERLVKSIRVPCPYAAHGCALKAVYYDQESHRSMCVHAPCHCPGEECSFVGSKAALVDHFSTAHRWPCITTVKSNDNGFYGVRLHDGFNLLLADLCIDNKSQGATANIQCLLLLTVARQSYARIISVHCIDPHAGTASGGQAPTSKEMQCQVQYSVLYENARSLSGNKQLVDYWQYQESRFRVVRTDLSSGLPKPDDCFQLVVPNSVIEDGIKVRVRIAVKK